jgi:predicted phage baseplate assembly protein
LKVVVDGVAWKEVPTLYAQPSGAAVYATRMRADGTAEVVFGDGLEGAMLPGGQNNVQATYRVGSGIAGNVGAGALTTLVDRPLGVGGVTNPQAATGGQDAQASADTRANAPLAVLTLGRAVSVADYEAFAAGFAGIAKASALWIPSGPARGVFLTVAGAGGVALPQGDPTLAKLVTALGTYGSSRVPVHVASFVETLFRIAAAVAFDPDRDAGVVSAAIVLALRAQYGFAARGFGQGVSVDEVAALIQGVPGVVGVNVLGLVVGASSLAGDLAGSGWTLHAFQQWATKQVAVDRPSAGPAGRICPYIPAAASGALPLPAEILVLDPDPKAINLSVLS